VHAVARSTFQRRINRLAALSLLAGLALTPSLPAAEQFDLGLSAEGQRIEGFSLPAPHGAPTVVVLGGLRGNDASVAQARAALERFERVPERKRPFRLYAVPLANPDGAHLEFPPTGTAYRDHPESHVLWRWIGLHAPDLVLVSGDDEPGLAAALARAPAAEVGRIPARRLTTRDLATLRASGIARSEADLEMQRRRARSPLALAQELAGYYGHEFKQPIYIDAIALIAQLRLGHLEEVKHLVEPYVSGERDSLERPSSLVLAGHTVFAELARRTGDPRYLARVRAAADLGFEPDGRMKEAMPYHGEFSDSVFMGTVMLAEAGALTGERRYFDMAARHIRFMQRLVLRPDGLYRHQPSTEAAWGRGNAFAALGLAWVLADFPHDQPDYPWILRSYQDHMARLAQFQNEDGLWRNVIDYPGAYGEFSATAMIAWAMQRGLENGWLPAAPYSRAVQRAWIAVVERVSGGGRLVDVCESTARMGSLEEYLHRAAILGQDPRGGAMAMLLATELAGLK
jgi:rhamnogalacturonyl hydrolase YesR